MSLDQEISEWDGKSTDDIAVIFNRYVNEKGFLQKIVKLLGSEAHQKGASWLLKRYFEDDGKVSKAQAITVYKLCPTFNTWEVQLHILQCLPYMEIADTSKKLVENFLRKGLIANNKFVRAWSYNGFYVLSMQYPEYVEETKLFFDMAMRDEAPSVKARIRNIIKNGF